MPDQPKGRPDGLHASNEEIALIEMAADPSAAQTLLEAMATFDRATSDSGRAFDEFASFVDTSRYGIGEWIAAFHVLDTWLQSNDRPREYEMMLGYLGCCAESQTGKVYPEPSLADLTESMLNEYGYQG